MPSSLSHIKVTSFFLSQKKKKKGYQFIEAKIISYAFQEEKNNNVLCCATTDSFPLVTGQFEYE